MIITIDGPAGSGKSTAARQLAKALGIAYLDTGAMYRALTLAALRRKLDLANEAALEELARGLDLRLEQTGGQLRVILAGQDASREIRQAEVTENAHYAARAPGVRAVLVDKQRQIGLQLNRSAGGVVAEGRDQGSVVFPDADFKFFLDATPEVRARRRCEEMLADGQQADFQQVLQALLTRDGRDRSRLAAPLVVPEGAIQIDTSRMSIEEVTLRLKQVVERGR